MTNFQTFYVHVEVNGVNMVIKIFSIFVTGDATDIRYQIMINCDLQMVGDEFSRKPYAIAVQQGSPLKDQFNNA